MKYTAKCIIKKNNQILLIKHQNEPKGWAIPGGVVEKNETAKQGIRRELEEEFNLEITHFDKILEIEQDNECIIIFECHFPDRAEIKLNRDEIKEVRWFGLSELPDNLGPRTQKIFSAYLESS